jgi:hypothetical protein
MSKIFRCTDSKFCFIFFSISTALYFFPISNFSASLWIYKLLKFVHRIISTLLHVMYNIRYTIKVRLQYIWFLSKITRYWGKNITVRVCCRQIKIRNIYHFARTLLFFSLKEVSDISYFYNIILSSFLAFKTNVQLRL